LREWTAGLNWLIENKKEFGLGSFSRPMGQAKDLMAD